ncbi:NAD(P)H-dependent oxidoreductase [Bacillus sp. SJS]|uniref:NAD(P)H-dependent oxidoreductase n=1 Tax=Bacillus sp. SJS TaxID=1423321 RepID=UPI0004DD7260|nr:NAD(P)H-dependent oxidoreductase [Bacillus sp. SJS]KZZ84623.1 NAD(P)H-dependent oxidoreductase [Bacillus sp. SJS]
MNIQDKKQEILTAFQFRHATKQFDAAKKIPEEDFQFILETARLSPSSFGYEPWKILVVQNKEIREKLMPYTWGGKGQLPTASHFVLIFSRNEKDMHHESAYIQHMMDANGLPEESQKIRRSIFKTFQESDFKLLESSRAMFDWSSKQSYIALANMMTSAAQIGIDSCPIEGFDKDKVEQVLREEGILTGDNLELSVMAAFGYRVDEPRAKTRQSLDTLVNWV